MTKQSRIEADKKIREELILDSDDRVFFSNCFFSQSQGRIYVKDPLWNLTQLLYLRIIERHLGPLPKGTIVHHIDGNPLNNKKENLAVCLNQKAHGALHKQLNEANKMKMLRESLRDINS